jgi:hypothetical protein
MTEHYLTEDFLDLVIQNGRAFRIMQNRRFKKTKGPINIALVKRELWNNKLINQPVFD